MVHRNYPSARVSLTLCSVFVLVGCSSVSADVDPNYQPPSKPSIAPPALDEPASQSVESAEVVGKSAESSGQPQPTAAPAVQQGGGPLEDQPLIIDTEGLIDEDGVGRINFQWQVLENSGRWVMADNGGGQAFTPRQGDVGKALRARIEYLDGQGTLETITTPATGLVQNVNDLPVGRVRLTGTPREDQTLQIDASDLTDEDGLGVLQYGWQRSVDGINWSSYLTNSADPSLLRLNQDQVGYAYRGNVTYVDGYGTSEALITSSSGVIQNIDDPAVGSISISSPVQKGARLSVDTSKVSDEDGIASITATWQISSDGVSWQAASDVQNRELVLNKSHVGQVIRARAVVVDDFGNQSEIYSSVSTPVQNVNSSPAGVVRIITAE